MCVSEARIQRFLDILRAQVNHPDVPGCSNHIYFEPVSD